MASECVCPMCGEDTDEWLCSICFDAGCDDIEAKC